jgi:hypothetical protein
MLFLLPACGTGGTERPIDRIAPALFNADQYANRWPRALG